MDTLPDPSLGGLWIFQMNDCDWYCAHSLKEAKDQYFADTGFTEEDIEDEDCRALTDEEMDRLQYLDTEDPSELMEPQNWICQCGHKGGIGDRWTGEVWQHSHGYPVGHVDMTPIHRRSFRAQLAMQVAGGDLEPGLFASTEY